MYYAVIILLMLVLPAGSIAVEHFVLHSPLSWVALIGRWFVIWGVGARLLLAGVRQVLKPGFTAETIFDLSDKAAQHIVQELGFGNIALGVMGVMCLWFPVWTPAAAVSGGIFFAMAGVKHVLHAPRTPQQNAAMVSDLFIALVMAGYLAATVGGL